MVFFAPMTVNGKLSRSRQWQLRKKKAGYCQWCGARPARKITFLDGHSRISALCKVCAKKQKGTKCP